MKKTIKTSQKNIHYAGVHLIAEFWDGEIIESTKKIKEILFEAAKATKSTPLGIKTHKFSPMGITGFILLAESHISIHTWPEKNYIAIDVFSCGRDTKPKLGIDYLKKQFKPKRFKIKEIKRGN